MNSSIGNLFVMEQTYMQESQEQSNQLRAKETKNFMKPDIDLWLSKNNLSKLKTVTKDCKDPKTKNKKKKALKTVIIENLHKLEENKDIDVQNIISILPIKYKRSIIRLLCLTSLKKVSTILKNFFLNRIYIHPKPFSTYYIEINCHAYILINSSILICRFHCLQI